MYNKSLHLQGSHKECEVESGEEDVQVEYSQLKQVSVDVVEKSMEMQLGSSSNKVYIEVIMLDDYEFVLRLEVLDHTNAMLVSFAYAI